jgi:hypothetical protein
MASTQNTARAARSAAHAAPDPAPVPDTSAVPGNAAAAVHAALAAHPGATTTVIAATAGIGRPAARDALAALEAAGAAARTKGGKPGIPDTWNLAAPDPSGSEHAAGSGQQEKAGDLPADAGGDLAQAARPGGDPAEGSSPVGQDTAESHEPDKTTLPAGGSAPAGTPAPDPALVAQIAGHIVQIQAAATTALAGGGDLHAVQAGLDEVYEQAVQARRAVKAAAGGKTTPAARPGGLREKILAHLRDHPGGSFTPHEIHKVTGHSSGAIANALDTLVKHGDAELAAEKPRRFRLAGNAATPIGGRPPAEPGPEPAGAGKAADLVGAA